MLFDGLQEHLRMSDVFQLPPKLDLSTVSQLVTDLKAIDGDVLLDATEVKQLGSLCLQAIIASARDAKTRGAKFEIQNGSDALRHQIEILGVTPDSFMEGTI